MFSNTFDRSVVRFKNIYFTYLGPISPIFILYSSDNRTYNRTYKHDKKDSRIDARFAYNVLPLYANLEERRKKTTT